MLTDTQFEFHRNHSAPDLIIALVQKWTKELRRFVTTRGYSISEASNEAMLFYSAWNLYCPVCYVDKGCMTVIMSKPAFIEKAQALLADTNTYQQVAIDPTPQPGNRITQTLKRLKDAGQITKTDYMRMKP
eukprot:g43285.t1